MSESENWVQHRTRQAQSKCPVPDAVASRVRDLVSQQLSQRQLRAGGMEEFARKLLQDMVPKPTQPPSKEVDRAG